MWFASRLGAGIAVFAIVSALAAVFGATNMGTALAFGQLAFAGAMGVLIIRT